jgi:hypothetical protein
VKKKIPPMQGIKSPKYLIDRGKLSPGENSRKVFKTPKRRRPGGNKVSPKPETEVLLFKDESSDSSSRINENEEL